MADDRLGLDAVCNVAAGKEACITSGGAKGDLVSGMSSINVGSELKKAGGNGDSEGNVIRVGVVVGIDVVGIHGGHQTMEHLNGR